MLFFSSSGDQRVNCSRGRKEELMVENDLYGERDIQSPVTVTNVKSNFTHNPGRNRLYR